MRKAVDDGLMGGAHLHAAPHLARRRRSSAGGGGGGGGGFFGGSRGNATAALALLAGLLACLWVYNLMYQASGARLAAHAIVVSALHQHFSYFEAGPDSAGAASEAQLLRQWSEVWEAARDAGSKQDFIAVMMELRRRHAAEAEVARADAHSAPGGPAAPAGAGAAPAAAAPAAAPPRRAVAPTPQPLSADLARGAACGGGPGGGGALVVTVAASERLDLLLAWAGALDGLGLPCYLVGATDEALAWELAGRGIPSFLMYHRDQAAPDIDPRAWRDMQQPGRQRVGLARALLQYGLDLVALSDCDGLWLGDGLAYARGYPAADVLVAGLHLTPGSPANDTGLEPPSARLAGALDTALLFLRNTPRTLAFVDAWADAADAGGARPDGHAFGELALAGWAPPAVAAPPPRAPPPPAAPPDVDGHLAARRAGAAAAAGGGPPPGPVDVEAMAAELARFAEGAAADALAAAEARRVAGAGAAAPGAGRLPPPPPPPRRAMEDPMASDGDGGGAAAGGAPAQTRPPPPAPPPPPPPLMADDDEVDAPTPTSAPRPFDAAAAAAASGLPPAAPPPGSRLLAGWHGRLLVGVLPLWLFPNGHAYWVQRLHELPGAPRPLAVRASHAFGGLPAKRHRLREAQLFADGPAYYYDPATQAPRYVSFDLPLRPELSPAAFAALPPDAMRQYHGRGLALQLEQFWQARTRAARMLARGMALGVALGRGLLLPRFLCFCDKHWLGVERCRLPGADMVQYAHARAGRECGRERLPFPCPLDHVMAPERFDDAGSDLAITMREAGAITNPRAPPELRHGVLTITPTAGLSAPREVWAGDALAGGPGLLLPQGLGQAALAAALSNYSHYPGFDDPRLAASFKRRVDHLRPLL
ncbi:MAG: hypothetical protein J3K34DRAFT_482887 [Monoraphidium minutum]|nr:MAG: hypothetical protein J3K34DRAFT_482887 [Monoraphidium minutum]